GGREPPAGRSGPWAGPTPAAPAGRPCPRAVPGTSQLASRVERVAQAITHEVDPEHGEHDREPGEQGPPPVALRDEIQRVGERVSPGRDADVDAVAKKTDERFADDHASHREC